MTHDRRKFLVRQAQAAVADAAASLHERLAAALGWTVKDVQSFSLSMLREMVREKSPALAQEITDAIASGMYIARVEMMTGGPMWSCSKCGRLSSSPGDCECGARGSARKLEG